MEAKLYWKEAGEACYATGSDVMAARFGHAVSLVEKCAAWEI